MKHLAILLLITASVIGACSCQSHRPKSQVTRTTVSTPAGRFGVGSTTTTEVPYENSSYHDSGVAMFSRP